MSHARILHLSDLHYGPPAVPAQLDAAARMIRENAYDLVVLSGDVSQRARAREFRQAKHFLDTARRVAPVLVVPGNHDVTWWRSPLRVFGHAPMLAKYRHHFEDECEPRWRGGPLYVVGLNSCHGISPRTLTGRPRDLSIIGDLTPVQLARARAAFAEAPSGTLKVAVVHHNVTRGLLSRRLGLRHTDDVVHAFLDMGVGLVLCGHDHQEAVELVERGGQRLVVSTAGTISDRSRGGRPSSVTELVCGASAVEARIAFWDASVGGFSPGIPQRFALRS